MGVFVCCFLFVSHGLPLFVVLLEFALALDGCCKEFNKRHYIVLAFVYRVFSLTWPASMQIYWNKRKRLHKKRAQLPEDWFGTPTWPPFHCFGTPIWPP